MIYTAHIEAVSGDYLAFGQGGLASVEAARDWIQAQFDTDSSYSTGVIVIDDPDCCGPDELGYCRAHFVEEVRAQR